MLFNGIRVAKLLVFCLTLCASLSYFYWPLYCLSSFFDLRRLVTPLVSSDFSVLYKIYNVQTKSNNYLDLVVIVEGHVIFNGQTTQHSKYKQKTCIIKTKTSQISNLVRTTICWYNLQNRETDAKYNLEVFVNNKTKGPKRFSQIWPRSPMLEEGEAPCFY